MWFAPITGGEPPWIAIFVCANSVGSSDEPGFERTVMLDVLLTGLSILLEFRRPDCLTYQGTAPPASFPNTRRSRRPGAFGHATRHPDPVKLCPKPFRTNRFRERPCRWTDHGASRIAPLLVQQILSRQASEHGVVTHLCARLSATLGIRNLLKSARTHGLPA